MGGAYTDPVKGGLAVGEAVLEAASRGQADLLLPLQGVLTLRLRPLTPPVRLQGVGSLTAPACTQAQTVKAQGCTDTDRHRHRHRQAQTVTDRQAQTQTGTDTGRDSQDQAGTDTDMYRHRHGQSRPGLQRMSVLLPEVINTQ